MDFEIYWTLIGGDIHFANRKASARQAWEAHPEKHFAIITWLRAHGKYPNRNPYFFILDFQAKKRQEMSFQQYYKQFGTTEERDGWKMIKPLKPGDPPVHYVKSSGPSRDHLPRTK